MSSYMSYTRSDGKRECSVKFESEVKKWVVIMYFVVYVPRSVLCGY